MPVNALPQDLLDRLQAENLTAAVQGAPPPVNLAAATTMHDDGLLLYRGRRYRVPPVPWRAGVRLMALDFEYAQLRTHQLEGEALRQFAFVVREMMVLMSGLVARSWWQRLRARGRRLFEDAELEELEDLRRFFFSARMRSPVFGSASIRAPTWCQPTWPTDSAASLVGIRAGWRRTATPVAIGTSHSA